MKRFIAWLKRLLKRLLFDPEPWKSETHASTRYDNAGE